MGTAPVTVWISRSRPGAERQADDLRAAGYRPLVAPVIDIEAVPGQPPPGPFELVIFLSEHAVRLGLDALRCQPWFASAQIFAVGGRTAEALAAAGVTAGMPATPTSEGLLQLEPLSRVDGQCVLLVSGVGGRGVLGDTLTRRGADVERFECYRRVAAGRVDPAVLGSDVIIAASGEGLRAVAGFWLDGGGRADVPVLVPSARVAALGVELGLGNLHDCGGADSGAWLHALAQLNPAESS
ncbi:MAG: uroporphyrinogen-III synthase [Gammaproteobacteria bacterium]|nr:uroporphyrinogen-III synthase [Gammaproteobacteria bacterium]